MAVQTDMSTINISVVIPARNRASVISRAIKSVRAQTFRPLEIIVVDDGSDDNGATIKAVQDQHDEVIPISIIELENRGGAPRARNIGVNAAKGDWIALLDSDDAWEPEKLAEQISLVEPGVSAVFTDTHFESPEGNLKTKFNGTPGDPDDLIFSNSLGGCSVALIDREAFMDVGGFDETLPSCQDWNLWLKLNDYGDLRVSPLPLTNYFFDGGERISRDVGAIVKGHEILYEKIIDRVDEEDAPAMRRFQAFHLAQTKTYFAGTAAGVFGPALRNLISPHPRTSRRSTVHMLLSAMTLKLRQSA